MIASPAPVCKNWSWVRQNSAYSLLKEHIKIAILGDFCSSSGSLTLGKLRSAAGSLQTRLLSFFYARGAGQKAMLFKEPATFRVHGNDGAGNGVAHAFRLRVYAAAMDLASDIDTFKNAYRIEGLLDNNAQILSGKIFLKGQFIDGNRAVAA